MSGMSGGEAAIQGLIQEAARIESMRQGRPLTPDEVRTIQAVAFLRRIAPYLFGKSGSPEDHEVHIAH